MPDRVIRDELLNSDRWLDLPTDTHRLVYIALVLIADDYGNLKGGPRRLFRWMHSFSQIKTEVDSVKLLIDLMDADLVGRYEVNGDEHWHVQRFKNSRWYWARKWPESGFQDDVTNEKKQRPTQNRSTHVINARTTRREGVGVGVGVHLRASRTPSGVKILVALGVDPQIAADWITLRKAKRAPLTHSALDDLKREAAKAGISLPEAVRICASRGWQGFQASWLKPEDHPNPEKKFVI
jgi:hypothetical protein